MPAGGAGSTPAIMSPRLGGMLPGGCKGGMANAGCGGSMPNAAGKGGVMHMQVFVCAPRGWSEWPADLSIFGRVATPALAWMCCICCVAAGLADLAPGMRLLRCVHSAAIQASDCGQRGRATPWDGRHACTLAGPGRCRTHLGLPGPLPPSAGFRPASGAGETRDIRAMIRIYAKCGFVFSRHCSRVAPSPNFRPGVAQPSASKLFVCLCWSLWQVPRRHAAFEPARRSTPTSSSLPSRRAALASRT